MTESARTPPTAVHARTPSTRSKNNMNGGRLTLAPDETAREYLRRSLRARGRWASRRWRGRSTGEVVELYGPAAAGKTSLLLQICASWSLPDSHGGGCRKVVWLDCDGRLRPSRLRASIYAYAARACERGAQEAAADALKSTSRVLRVLSGIPLRPGKPSPIRGRGALNPRGLHRRLFWREVKPAEDRRRAVFISSVRPRRR